MNDTQRHGITTTRLTHIGKAVLLNGMCQEKCLHLQNGTHRNAKLRTETR